MASTASLEGVKKAIFFPFKGKGWGLKMFIGSALMFANYIIPIVPAIPLLGYFGRIMKRVINENEDPEMPEWNDWGGLFSQGAKMLGVAVIALLPGLLIMIAGDVLFFFVNSAFMFSENSIPGNSSPFLGVGPFLGSMIGMFAGMFCMMLGLLVMIILITLMFPALGHMISKGEFGAAFRIREWWPIFKANIGGFFLTLSISYGVYFLLFIPIYLLYISIVLCWLMPFAMVALTFLQGTITFTLSAVAYRDAKMKLAAS